MANKEIEFGHNLKVLIPQEKAREGTALYIAGPLGFASASKPFHEKLIELVTAMGASPLDPWNLTPDHYFEQIGKMPPDSLEVINAWKKLNPIIAKNNVEAIKKSSGLIAILDGSDVDSGTAAEVGYGYSLGKPIIGIASDLRTSRDNTGGIVNLQVQYFIEDSASGQGKIIRSVKDLPPEILRIWGN